LRKNKSADKNIIKIDKVDWYIKRYRENLKLQEELEVKRKKNNFFDFIFKRKSS